MPSTSNATLVKLSQRIYKEWYRKTVLVQSCDNSFEGELNLETRELDIPVYHDLSVHLTSLKERELKPAGIEFIKASTKRVSIDKGRYSHWGVTEISKLVDKLSAENSETRKKLINKWALEAENELGIWAGNNATLIDLTATDLIDADEQVNTTSIIKVLDILKAKVIEKNMTPDDFTLFASEKFETVLRDTKLPYASLDANETFRTGSVGVVNGVKVHKHQIPALTYRNTTSSLVETEYAIWKTKDGIQYVVPYKNTINYEITPDQVLLGGQAYQTVEYYDFFNLYPTRLYRVKMQYVKTSDSPTFPPAITQ